MTATTPLVVAAGDGTRLEMIDGTHVVKAGQEATGGTFEVFEVQASRGPATPPHVSPWHAVAYVLEGDVLFELDGTQHPIGPGATIACPAGVPVTFAVTSESARILAITSGSGAGRFFADFARSVPADRPVPELLPDILAVTQRHGVSLPGAP